MADCLNSLGLAGEVLEYSSCNHPLLSLDLRSHLNSILNSCCSMDVTRMFIIQDAAEAWNNISLTDFQIYFDA